jgi:hypothetical protein
MSDQPENSSKSERHEAALMRAGRKAAPQRSAASYFHARSGQRLQIKNTHVLPSVRVPEELAEDIGEFGNRHLLSYSEAIRYLLARGLTRDEKS